MAKDTGKDDASGRRRAAAFLLALDSETAALVMRQMGEKEMSSLSEEMARVGELPGAEVEAALLEFSKRSGVDHISAGPMVSALLERALGKERAAAMMEKLERKTHGSQPFKCLDGFDAAQVAKVLEGEHPQVWALVAMHLDTNISSQVIKDIPEDLRYDVLRRMASSEELPEDLVRQVAKAVETRAATINRGGGDSDPKLRFKTVAQVLTVSDPKVSKPLIERLAKDSPNVANEIQAMMFVFEDLLKIPDRDMQKVLSEVDKADLALALKASPKDVGDKLLNNLSNRARDNIKEEIEMLGPKPLREVEEAQKRIITVVRAMEERGDIKVIRGGGGSGEVMV